jgi:predicted RNA-binding protein with TRAM domain
VAAVLRISNRNTKAILKNLCAGLPALLVGLVLLGGGVSPAAAEDVCIYPQLQILLPGEEPAPHTPTGKTGSPLAQTVGIPFQVRVRACTGDWETHPGVNHVINISSTDDQANLPLDTPLTRGELTTWVTLNSLGDFTITARDLSDGQHFSDTSPLVRVQEPETPATYLDITEVPRDQRAGQPVYLTISARRQDGSLDLTQGGVVNLHQLTSLGQGVVSPGSIQLEDGTWSGNVTFFLADPTETSRGSVILKARHLDDELEGLSNSFHVAPGPYSRLLVIAPGQNWTPWIVGGLNGAPEQQWADDEFHVDVYATDEWWNRVDVSDVVQLETGDASAIIPPATPLFQGHRTFPITLRTPGQWFLAVSDTDQPEIGGMVSDAVPVWYSHLQVLLPGELAAPGTETGKIGAPEPQVAGVPFSVVIRACNRNFEPVPTDRVVVRLGSTDHTAALPAAAPMHNGQLVARVTLNSAGSFTFTAEDIEGPEYYTTTTGPVTVTGSTGVVAGFAIEPIDGPLVAGQPVDVSLTAVDADGFRVHGSSGSVNLAQLVLEEPFSVEPAQITISEGAWSGQVTFFHAELSRDTHPEGHCLLQAASPADAALTGRSNRFQVAPGPLDRLQIVLPGQTLELGGGQVMGAPAAQTAGIPFDTEVLANDAWGNLVASGHVVSIDCEDPGASTPVQAALAAGRVTIPVTLGNVGNWTLTASDLTDPEVPPVTSDPVSVLGSSPEFQILPMEEPVTAGEPVTVTIFTVDPQGQVLRDFNGHALLAAETGPRTVSPTQIQFNEGRWSGPVTFYGAADQTTLSCLDYASPPNMGTSQAFQVLPGQFVGLQILLPGQENDGGRDPGHVGEPTEQEAGEAFSITVQAVDSWWNLVPGIDQEITLDSTDPFSDCPPTALLTDGRLTTPLTFKRAGDHTLTAGVAGGAIRSYTSSGFTVQAGPYARLLALAPGEELLSGSESGKTGLPQDQSISRTFRVRVHATDRWWNTVTGTADLISLACTDPMAVYPENFSLLDGYAEVQVKLSSAGYQLVTLTNLNNTEMPPAHTQMRAIESGFHIEAQVQPAQVVAGEPFTLSVRIVNDAGAVMADVNGSVEVSVINSVTQEPGEGELLNGSFQVLQGVRSISQTYTRSEPVVLVVSSPQTGTPGRTNVLTVVPGAPASLDFHETASWVGGRRTTDVTAKVSDSLGNGVPGMPVFFELAHGGGLLDIVNEVTDEQGLALARYTGADVSGSGLIQVAAAGFTTSMMIMTSLMDPGSSGGTISNYPNPFHPDEGSTTVSYVLSRNSSVTLRLFTLSGTLVLQRRYEPGTVGGSQGINEIEWDGRNGEGDLVASGGYILYVEAQDQGETIHQIRRRIAVVR